jgi:putative peptide zinc metalloprotease protein
MVTVEPFTRQLEGDEVIIGRIETGIFLAVPPEAVELLEDLARGKTVGEAANIYRQKHGETPDLDDFLGLMETKGMVKPCDAKHGEEQAPVASQPPLPAHYHFSNFPQRLAGGIFSPLAVACSLILTAFAAGIVVRNPSLAPRPRDLYFPDYRTLSWTILILASYLTLFMHELAHLVAARARGINSRMRISHRLWYLVAETDLTGLWSVPKRQRYLPMLAGALVDAVSGSVLVLLLFSLDRSWLVLSGLSVRLVRAMLFIYLMRIVWQCFLFVRTDFYYVIASFFNCKNLLRDTEIYLRNQLARVIPFIEWADQSAIPASERRVIRAYSVLWVAGRIAALSLLFVITIPLGVRYAQNLARALRAGYSFNPSNFIDALALAIYFFVPLAIGFTFWIRGLARGERT